MTLRGVYKPLSGKTSDYLCIGLCPTHHRHQEGIHTLGTSRWERMFGQQAIMLDRISATLNVDVWKLSGEKHVKIYRRPEKVLPRIVA